MKYQGNAIVIILLVVLYMVIDAQAQHKYDDQEIKKRSSHAVFRSNTRFPQRSMRNRRSTGPSEDPYDLVVMTLGLVNEKVTTMGNVLHALNDKITRLQESMDNKINTLTGEMETMKEAVKTENIKLQESVDTKITAMQAAIDNKMDSMLQASSEVTNSLHIQNTKFDGFNSGEQAWKTQQMRTSYTILEDTKTMLWKQEEQHGDLQMQLQVQGEQLQSHDALMNEQTEKIEQVGVQIESQSEQLTNMDRECVAKVSELETMVTRNITKAIAALNAPTSHTQEQPEESIKEIIIGGGWGSLEPHEPPLDPWTVGSSDTISQTQEPGLGGDGKPANSCQDIYSNRPNAASGAYWVKTPSGNVRTYCDLTDGGWTLIGQVDGKYTMWQMWLRSNTHTVNLITPTIRPKTYSCIDAIDMAVNHATKIRLSSGDSADGMGSYWAEWNLPPGRSTDTFWHHEVGQTTIDAAPNLDATVTAHTGSTYRCYQTVYGIHKNPNLGGFYPMTEKQGGSLTSRDWCMGVAVLEKGTSQHKVNGYYNNGNGYDVPSSDTDYPSRSYNTPQHVNVWLQ